MNHEKNDSARQSRHRLIRWAVLGLVTALLAAVAFLHQHPVFGWTPPGVDALCPFGGLEAFWALAASGEFLTKIAASSFILLVAALGVTLLFRRAFCGQLCPLGALQGAAAGLGKKLLGRKFRLPAPADRVLRWLKYAVLAGVTALTWIAGTLVIRPYDPWVAFMHLTSAELWTGFGVGLGVLVVSLGASLFLDRFFCRYLCPMGALYALVSKLGLYRVRREEALCIGCGKCDRTCPVDLPVSRGKDVTSAECLACGLCVNACPARGALVLAGPRNTKISPLFLTAATAAVFAAVIAVTAVPGWFSLSVKSLGEEVQAQRPAEGTPPEAPAAAVFDPDLIKGRHTFAEVAGQSGIPLPEFAAKFQLSEEALGKPIKEATASGAFTVGEVRGFVAEKLGITGYYSIEK